MKKLLTALLGLGLVLGAASPVLAWTKCNFGAGFNWGWEGGGNSFAWGLVKGDNIPPPGIPVGVGPEIGGPPMMAAPMMAPPMGMPAPPAADHHTPPRSMPNSMPRADAQPVGYFQPNQMQQAASAPTGDYAAPSYWYDR